MALDRGDRPPAGKLTLVFVAVIGVSLLVRWLLEPTAAGGPMVGVAAPDFEIETFDDAGTWQLSRALSQTTRPIVVNLWASWCEPCREEMPQLSAFARSRPDIIVVGVAVNDDESSARAMANELEPDYPVGIDTTGRLLDEYASIGLPATFVIDQQGIVRHQFDRPVVASELERVVG